MSPYVESNGRRFRLRRLQNQTPRAARVSIALLLAVAGLVAVASPSAAAYINEDAYACDSYTAIYSATGRPLAETDVVAPGTPCTKHDAAFFRRPDVVTYYNQFGFDRNFMYNAPISSVNLGNREFAGCKVAHPANNTNFCPADKIGFSPVTDVWNGPTTVKAWPENVATGGFIATVCGNFNPPTQTPPPGPIPSISGRKFEDVNGNGTKEVGEPWMAGVAMHLIKGGADLATDTTDSQGRYTFRLNANTDARFTPGTYTVREDVPSGYRKTTADPSVVIPDGAGDDDYPAANIGNQKLTDIQVTKSAETNPTIAGAETLWKIVVRNNGPWPAPSVTLSDTFPDDYTAIVSVSDPQCTATGLSLSCSFGTLAVGATRTVQVRALSKPDLAKDDDILNTARVATSMQESNYANNVSSATTRVDTRADISLRKRASGTTFDATELIDYTLEVTNNGPSWARDVIVTDPVPDRVAIINVTGPGAGRPNCTWTSQDLACELGDMTVGETITIIIHGRVRGTHPDDATNDGHTHLLDVQKAERTWDLAATTTGTFDLDCGGRGTVTDVSLATTYVDGGTSADIIRTAVRATGLTSGEITLTNNASGRAQGTMYLVCLQTRTVDGSDHHHTTQVAAPVTSFHDLPASPTASTDTTIVLEAGLATNVVAPGYRVIAGRPVLISSELREYGWELTFRTQPGEPATVESSYLPLTDYLTFADRTAGHPRHTHRLVFAHPVINVTLPPGPSEHTVTCPAGEVGMKGITATFDSPFPPDNIPEPVSRRFRVFNPTGTSVPASFDLLCLALKPGPTTDVEYPTNMATAASSTQDDEAGDNSDSVTVVTYFAPEPPSSSPAPRSITINKATQRKKALVTTIDSDFNGRARIIIKRGHHRLAATTLLLRSGHDSTLRLPVPRHRGADMVIVKLRDQIARHRIR